MNTLKNLRLGARLAMGFGLVLVLLVAVGVLGVHSMGQVQDRLEQIARVHNKEARLAVAMRIAVNQIAIQSRDIVLQTEEAAMRASSDAMTRSRANYDAAEDELGKMLTDQADTPQNVKDLFSKVRDIKAGTRPLISKVVTFGLANQNEPAAKALANEVTVPQRLWLNTLGELADAQDKLSIEAAQQAEASYSSARTLDIVLCVVGVVLGIGAAWGITVSITRPIAEAVDIAKTVAAGDLTSRIEVTSRDETGELLGALKAMNESLVRVVGTVRTSSDSIATGATQIASGNADLSQRTEEQASNLQQTAASMEELTSTVQANSETARQATQLAASASAVASKGGVVVGEVVATMQEISASSKKISDIIGVIDGIAFQTNILALNAAVEAARTGEQGRGFAVVATEVRSLAGRSAEAAKEIKALIGASVVKVDAGSRLVGDAGATMNDIVAQVKRVADLIGEISAATGEQTQGISQVSDAVTQLDQVTQQNAALVEESAAAADSLNQQALRLVQAVSVFKLDNGPSGSLPVASAPTRAMSSPAKPSRPTPVRLQVVAGNRSATAKASAKLTAAADKDDWEAF